MHRILARFSGHWRPAKGSTSTLFFQDVTGNRHLRLDYDFNPKANTVDFHRNQKGTFSNFKIPNHAPAGRTGAIFYEGAKYFRYGGRVLFIAGAAIDIYSIAVANNPIRQTTKVIAGWPGAWVECELAGAWCASGGTAVEPGGGTAVPGGGGCIVGGIAGYAGLSTIAGNVYDSAEDTIFTRMPESSEASADLSIVPGQ